MISGGYRKGALETNGLKDAKAAVRRCSSK